MVVADAGSPVSAVGGFRAGSIGSNVFDVGDRGVVLGEAVRSLRPS